MTIMSTLSTAYRMRVMKTNELTLITDEVAEAVRRALVIGVS
jgi:hypothetical protein